MYDKDKIKIFLEDFNESIYETFFSINENLLTS